MSRKKQRKENSTPLEKLELIYIGIKPFIRTTDRFQETILKQYKYLLWFIVELLMKYLK
jgi:hypothetical protein